MSATKYTNTSNNYHYKTESLIEIYNSELLEIKCMDFKKKFSFSMFSPIKYSDKTRHNRK